jgi:hypothetical protein
MRELSMHILDLAQNSISAGATRLEIGVTAFTAVFRDFGSIQSDESDEIEIPKHKPDTLTITIRDNGNGMSEDFAARVKDPFTTTRTVRRVGLGIPMFAESAMACDGDLTVESSPGNGTTVTAWFKLSHIDRAPLGDIAATLVSIIAANPEMSVRYVQRVDGEEFVLDTDDVKAQLDGVPINEGAVLRWIGDYVREQTNGEARIY